MAPKSKNSPNKKSSNVLDIGVKLKILNLLESGERVAAVARKFKINESTVRTVRDNKDKIRHSASTLGQFSHLSKVSRNPNIVKMEEMLMLWIQDLVHKKVSLDELETASISRKQKFLILLCQNLYSRVRRMPKKCCS